MLKLLTALLFVFTTVASAVVTCSSNLNPTGSLGAPVGAGNLTGCLTAQTGLTGSPDPGPWTNFEIAWNITPISGGYHYEYLFQDPDTSGGATVVKDISHLILGLSDNCIEATTTSTPNNCIWNLTSAAEGNAAKTNTTAQGNPGLNGGSLYGIKINTGSTTSFTFSFDSNRIPVWQNAYAKDGSTGGPGGGDDIFVNNNSAANYFVAAPDSVVPEPGFYGVLSLGFGALGIVVMRRRRAA